MSDVRLVVREAGQDWSGTVHRSDADLAVAALSADPVTLMELATAATRFVKPHAQRGLFGNLRPGSSDEPWDAGLVVIDLVARLVVVDSTYSSPGPVGTVWYHDEENEADADLPYHQADDWQFVHCNQTWRSVAEARRRERIGKPPLDARAVLYGLPLLKFVALETLAAFQRSGAAGAGDADRLYDTLKNIHAAWLLTPRGDLGIVCPREVMLERHNHLMRDLQDRREQWSQLGECPPGLEKSSFAFRYGGFGTHELVMYYELVRELLWSTWNHLEKLSRSQNVSHRPESLMPGDFLITEVPRLERVRDEWHDTPDPECHMRTPRSIIHRERRRLPEVVSGEEAMIDPDCPCCQMMCDTPGPIFWHLDGSEMDDDFAFDFHHSTREEWEEERRRWEESWKRIDDEREERRRLGVTDCSAGEPGDDSLWTSSFSVGAAELPLGGRVFGIGCHLAELIAALRGDMDREETPASVQQFINQLNRNFGNLRELLKAGPSMVETLFDPVIGCFVETLAEVSAVRLDLAPKCEALAHKVKNLLNDPPPTSAGGSSVSEIPF